MAIQLQHVALLAGVFVLCPGVKFKFGKALPCGVQATSYARYVGLKSNDSCTAGIRAVVEARVYRKCGRFIFDDDLVSVGRGDKVVAMEALRPRLADSAWAHAMITIIAKEAGVERVAVRGLSSEATMAVCSTLSVAI
jgi:hypothetical protein